MKSIFLVLLIGLTPRISLARSGDGPPNPAYVLLWFDTEDYVAPERDDGVMRLAEILTRHGVQASFRPVGERARVVGNWCQTAFAPIPTLRS